MKKLMIPVWIVSLCLVIACGGSDTSTSTATDSAPAAAPEVVESAHVEGLAESIKRGETVYGTYCVACHMPEGNGLEGAFPPLAKSDYLMADVTRSIRQIIYGKEGEIVVNGVTYNGVMPPQPLDDQQTADVLNYVMNTWGNEHNTLITPEQVAAERE